MTTPALTRVDPPQFASRRAAIAALDSAARAESGHDALGEAVWRDLDHPRAGSAGFFDDARGYAHVSRSESESSPPAWSAGIVEDPGAGAPASTPHLLSAVARHVADQGGGRITCWWFGASGADDARFAEAGWRRTRELYEMRVPMPLGEQPRWPAGIRVRPIDPALDESGWLRVNNRAFAGHPEQGDWSAETFRARAAEPWFDPSLFLVAVDSDGIAGFNWLKLHEPRDPDPALGEIYVIGVDPRTQGTGLGRALAVAGLHAAHSRGARAGMLFCAADNTGALALYRTLGFRVHRSDRAYELDVEAA